jgi:hypothetical protein
MLWFFQGCLHRTYENALPCKNVCFSFGWACRERIGSHSVLGMVSEHCQKTHQKKEGTTSINQKQEQHTRNKANWTKEGMMHRNGTHGNVCGTRRDWCHSLGVRGHTNAVSSPSPSQPPTPHGIPKATGRSGTDRNVCGA